jgi:hypothetical protein
LARLQQLLEIFFLMQHLFQYIFDIHQMLLLRLVLSSLLIEEVLAFGLHRFGLVLMLK